MTKKNEVTLAKEDLVADIIDRIPNGIHLYRIREALSKGHAAVMVGSGFSLNAENGNRLPLWEGLIDRLLEDLHTSDKARLKAKERLGGVSGMLRLADEYAAVRGRSQLERRLHELLPDAGIVMPGELHAKLLSLDWADVYTTNYDTLLERALDTDRREFKREIRRQYQIVVAASDVPFSKSNGRPRVVKLHGSLRAGSRLIVSEDDYRTYPTDFAPFVNMVQQSMLENVFCLIGFSGDDPNFLLWTGWVRDRLRDRTPPVYLITLNSMSEGQRLILERRNIFPIDITELGLSDGKKDHAASLKALLDFWMAKPPQRLAKWPLAEPGREFGATPEVAQLIAWIEGAQRNRNEYPGWLVAPVDNRKRLGDCSTLWRAIATFRQHKSGMPLWLRIVFLDEVAWIFDTMLEPLNLPYAQEIEDALNLAFPEEASAADPALPESAFRLKPEVDELSILRANLTVTMLRDAREDGDIGKFEGWKARLDLSPRSGLPPDIRRAALHEEVLLNLARRKRDEVLRLLNDLESVKGPEKDPYWRIRIGALFGEVGVIKRGRELVRAGLHSIREMIQADTETVYLLSREHWAERLLEVYLVAIGDEEARNRQYLFKTPPPLPDSRPPEVSLQTLILREEERAKTDTSNDADIQRDKSARERVEHPNVQTGLVLREIEIADEMLRSTEVPFDAHVLPVCDATPRVRKEAIEAALAFCRLSERAAVVSSVGRLGFSARNWASCHRVLSVAFGAERTMSLLFRANSGSTLASAETLTLAAVATLSPELALAVFTQSINEIEGIVEQGHRSWDKTTVPSLKFSLDVSSRVAFRLDSEQAVALTRLAIRLHGLQALQDEFSMHRSFGLFFARGLRLLSRKNLADLCPELISLDVPDKALLRPHQWPDVAELLRQFDAQPKPGVRWRKVVDEAISRASIPSDIRERNAFNMTRLDWLYRRRLMSATQQQRFAMLIWQGVPPGQLPVVPGFYRGASLTWPHPPGKSPEAPFLSWLRTEPVERIQRSFEHDGKTVLGISGPNESLLVNVLLTENDDVQLSWTAAELVPVVDKLRAWWNEEGLPLMERASKEQGEGSTRDIMTSRLRLIAHAAQRVIARCITRPEARQRGIPDWFAEMWEAGLRLESPLVPLMFAALSWWPERSTEVIDIAIAILSSSNDPYVVNAGLSAAGRWLLREQTQTEATRRYVDYLVESIRSQTERHLDAKLQSIDELLNLGARRHFEPHRHNLNALLSALLFELQDRRAANNPFTSASRPLLRVAVVSLLSTIHAKLGGDSNGPLGGWAADLARVDSLLVVRNII